MICILSVLYSYCGVSDSEKIENVTGNINNVSKTDVALISIDNSEDFLSSEPQNCECGGMDSPGDFDCGNNWISDSQRHDQSSLSFQEFDPETFGESSQ